MKKICFALFTLFTVNMLSAQFGPDHNLRMSKQETFSIIVPAGMQLELKFEAHAHSENAACVYITNPYRPGRLTKVLERGNYRRSLNSWVSQPMLQDTEFVFSGWHKQAYGGGNPWWQSPLRLRNYGTYSATISFDDSNFAGSDSDFNDLLIHYEIFFSE